jgi:hypothetical protein
VVWNIIISGVSFILLTHIDVIVYEHRVGFDALVRGNEWAKVLEGSEFDPFGRII